MSNLSATFDRWESMRYTYYDNGPGRMEPPGVDCSGSIKWAAGPFVDPIARALGYGPLPTISATVADWAIRNGLTKPMTRRAPGDLLVYDKYGQPQLGYGNRGHIGQCRTFDTTWESRGGKGVNIYQFSMTGWQMCVNMAPFFGTAGPGMSVPIGRTAPPPIDWEGIRRAVEEQLREDDMILFLRNATPGSGEQWAVVGSKPIYLDSPRASSEMQNIAETFGQRNVRFRDTDPNVLQMLGCVR